MHAYGYVPNVFRGAVGWDCTPARASPRLPAQVVSVMGHDVVALDCVGGTVLALTGRVAEAERLAAIGSRVVNGYLQFAWRWAA